MFLEELKSEKKPEEFQKDQPNQWELIKSQEISPLSPQKKSNSPQK